MTKGRIAGVVAEVSKAKKLLAILPKMRGMTIKKENLAAFSLSIPKSTAVAMVAPLLEIPGKIATACMLPIQKAEA